MGGMMKKEYVMEFLYKGKADQVTFFAANLLELIDQVDDWCGCGPLAPIYKDEIYSIEEVRS